MSSLPRLLSSSALALSLVMAACSSTPPAPPAAEETKAAAPIAAAPVAAPTPAAPAAVPAQVSRPSASSVATVQAGSGAAAAAPATPGAPTAAADRSIFFDFDEVTIKPEFFAAIERHGKYLASRPAASVRIEGNADERGTKEYNLALGQKQDDAVAKALKVYGVKDTQVEAVSLGEEKPLAEGHDEAAWAKNRRADVEYTKR